MSPSQSKPQLAQVLPLEQVATRDWLEKQGFGRHTLDNLLKSHQLQALTAGVYARPELPVSWQGVVASLPRLVQEPVLVGGLSSLRLQGFAHYVSLGAESVDLVSPAVCPTWLARCFDVLGVPLAWSRGVRLWANGWPQQTGVKEIIGPRGERLLVSPPEQAWLELLAVVPDRISLEHAENILQGLTQLSPQRLSSLLRECRHVKVKRIFFWLADRQGHPWRKKLDPKSFDLGTGKRSLTKGGKLDPLYQITVPQEMLHEH